VSEEIDRVAAYAQTATKWRRAHPGTSAHIKMARATAKRESTEAMGALRALILGQAPAHWDVADWGFSVAANLRDARWDQRGGKGRASWSNHVYAHSAASLAAFAGRIFAAFDVARAAPTDGASSAWFRFALPEAQRNGLGPALETSWCFATQAVSGKGADDAFATGLFLGVFAKASPTAKAKASFVAAYHHGLQQHALAVASRAPALTTRLLAHPKAKLLMAAQIEPNDTRRLEVFQHVVAQSSTVAPNPTLTTRSQTLAAAEAMETLLGGILDALDGLGQPIPTSEWRVWKTNNSFHRIRAWDLASASAMAAIDDLQMITDARSPAHYVQILETTP
jgi:hypothetical protein